MTKTACTCGLHQRLQRIAWRSVTGAQNDGVVTFDRTGDDSVRVTLRMHYETESAIEDVGEAAGMLERTVEDDLGRFKEFIESRGASTGAWRGKVGESRPQSPP